MSGKELAEFLLPHMHAIVPFLADHPKIQTAWLALLKRMALFESQYQFDELLPWIRSVVRAEQDDVIELNLTCVEPQTGPTYFLML
jgi:hypothetical protein